MACDTCYMIVNQVFFLVIVCLPSTYVLCMMTIIFYPVVSPSASHQLFSSTSTWQTYSGVMHQVHNYALTRKETVMNE